MSRLAPLLACAALCALGSLAGADELVEEARPFTIDVELASGAERVQVEGRLTRPAGLAQGQTVPGVLLIHGSNRGSELRKDVDGTIPPDKTHTGESATRWRDLAHALTRAGFVVYRHAKRGYALAPDRDRLDVVHSITFSRTVADSRQALSVLRASPGVDPDRILLVGHSEGTMVAPELAEDDPGIAGLVLLGPVVDFARVVRFQLVVKPIADVFQAFDGDDDDRLDPPELAAAQGSGRRLPTWLRYPSADANGDGDLTRAEALAFLGASFQVSARRSRATPDDYWYGHYRARTNLSRLPSLRLPLVVVTGELDWRTPAAHARELEAALDAAGHPDHVFRYPAGLGHGFSPPLPPEPDAYSPRETAGPPDPGVLDELGALLAARFLGPR